jgi:hypothetical protein
MDHMLRLISKREQKKREKIVISKSQDMETGVLLPFVPDSQPSENYSDLEGSGDTLGN